MTYYSEDLIPREILHHSKSYEAQIAKDMRDNPHVEVNMMVTVYSYYDHDVPIGVGIVKKVKWSSYYGQHLCDVLLGDGLACGIAAARLKRRVFENIIPYIDVINGCSHE